MDQARLFLAILHYPVTNKRGEVVTTAPLGPDIHDIARSCATYGVERYYVATPLERHQAFVRRMVEHWTVGFGASYNPDRKAALELVEVVGDLDEAVESIRERTGKRPFTVATTARQGFANLSFEELRRRLGQSREPCLLVLGTGFGLTDECLASCDACLEPIRGPTAYNHLSVRSAAAIILDRLRAVG
jgi:hypothetical protein